MPRCRCVWVGSKNKNVFFNRALFLLRAFIESKFPLFFSFPHGDYDDVCFRAMPRSARHTLKVEQPAKGGSAERGHSSEP